LRNTTARPVCFSSRGSIAAGLITAPSGARLPRSTARPSRSTSGLSRRRITSSLNTAAPAMFSPSVQPLTVGAPVSSRSVSCASSARRPPA